MFGKTVYHVANPQVKGVIIDPKQDPAAYVGVVFEEEVSFEGIARSGREWYCNPKLLFGSTEEAIANDDLNWRFKEPYKSLMGT